MYGVFSPIEGLIHRHAGLCIAALSSAEDIKIVNINSSIHDKILIRESNGNPII